MLQRALFQDGGSGSWIFDAKLLSADGKTRKKPLREMQRVDSDKGEVYREIDLSLTDRIDRIVGIMCYLF